jgi:hypothetical protein
MSSKELPKRLEEDLKNVKNYRRSPLNENAVNYLSSGDDSTRRPSLKKVFDDSAESKMYDEIFGGVLNTKSKLPTGSGFEAARKSSSQEKDFTATLLSRLKILEEESKESRKKLAEEINRNIKLEGEIAVLKAPLVKSNTHDSYMERIRHLEKQNQELSKEVRDMKEFLADYGLEWVGNSIPVAKDISISTDPLGHIVSFKDFEKAIQKLNEIIFAEPAQFMVENTSRKARLTYASERANKILISYYKDGLLINRGPFRLCCAPSYSTFVQDILDGYFPSEFRDEYPDGVLFELINKQGDTYDATKNFISAEDFVSKFKKSAIVNGDVLDLQKDIRLRLRLGPSGQPESEAPKFIYLKTNISELSDRTSIHIKWKQNTTIIADMAVDDSILDLKKLIQEQLNEEKSNYELRTAFPPRKLMDSESFRSINLFPNGLIHSKFNVCE